MSAIWTPCVCGGDGRGWYMMMLNHKGEPPREERDALRTALGRVGGGT